MEPIYDRCAGLDVHKKTVTVCRIYHYYRTLQTEANRR
jgi:hypothetical protein